MYLLLRDYLSERLQAHFDTLQLPQTDSILEHTALMESLRAKGAIQSVEAPEESNIFRWPFSLKEDDSDPLFLKHCCLRFFYTYSDGKCEKRQLYLTMGLFSTFACKNEKPEELADEIMRIDNELIPLWMKEFEALPSKDIMNRALKSFIRQRHKFHGKELVLDSFAASVYGVSVAQVRQAISRKRNGFTEECAFHLTYEEHKEWYRKFLNPPKIRRSDYLPYAITFEGFCLLSMSLPSPIAGKIHLGIIETISAKSSLGNKKTQIYKHENYNHPTNQDSSLSRERHL